MILRELTQNEKNELSRFQTDGDGYKVLLGMIAVDLMQDKAFERPLSYLEFADYVTIDTYHENDPFIIEPVLETWLISLVNNNNIVIDDDVKKKIFCLAICFINTICQISPEINGKKYKKLVGLYREQEQKLYEEKGKWLHNLPEECYRYIVTCLEYMDFKREPTVGEKVIDMSNIYYNDLFE